MNKENNVTKTQTVIATDLHAVLTKFVNDPASSGKVTASGVAAKVIVLDLEEAAAIKAALDSDIKDVDFKIIDPLTDDLSGDHYIGHYYDSEYDCCAPRCPSCKLEAEEAVRLEAEERPEYTINRSVPGLHGASHTCTDDWVDDHSEQDCAACMGCGVQSCPTCGWSESPKGKTISPDEKFEAAIRAGKLKIGPQ